MTREAGESMAAPCNYLWNFLLNQKMQFSAGIFLTSVKSMQIEILELITSSAADTDVLVKTAQISNDTKVSSSEFTERCSIFWMKSVLSLTKNDVLLQ